MDIKALGVVTNLDTNTLGILTGNISIKINDFEQRDQIISQLDGKVIQEYPHLKLVHIQFDQLPDFDQGLKTIKQSSIVSRHNIEILEFEKIGK